MQFCSLFRCCPSARALARKAVDDAEMPENADLTFNAISCLRWLPCSMLSRTNCLLDPVIASNLRSLSKHS